MWPEIKSDYERLKDDVFYFLERNLKLAISEDYVHNICLEILDEVVADVTETSAFSKNGTWNDNDIKLAVGRVLVKRLGIEC